MASQNFVCLYMYYLFPAELEERFVTGLLIKTQKQGPHNVLPVDVLTLLSGNWLLQTLRKYKESIIITHMCSDY